ncbi:hypothetical protein AB205_0115000 [Aquarana catesbeiana]|uniref:C2H2-type domain-containing protein n=1 Tax=Aquarana catesbeiana TaxID=8400 RepID=A0A2G9SER3_AQUCT|nr:hypothetical protein AB205_0115000 [Aquarana catesbeiana]
MMENRPPLTSPDESSNRNPPERCPHPLYSRNSTQEHQEIPQEDQSKHLFAIKVEVKEEAENPSVIGDVPCKEEEIPLEISTDPGDSRATQRDIKVKEEKEERPVKVIEEDIAIEIGTDGRYRRYDTEEPPAVLSGGEKGDDVTSDSSEDDDVTSDSSEDDDVTSDSSEKKHIPQKFHAAPHSADMQSDPSKHGRSVADHSTCGTHDGPTQDKPLVKHQRNRTCVVQFSCSECGRDFRRKSSLVVHKEMHKRLHLMFQQNHKEEKPQGRY